MPIHNLIFVRFLSLDDPHACPIPAFAPSRNPNQKKSTQSSIFCTVKSPKESHPP